MLGMPTNRMASHKTAYYINSDDLNTLFTILVIGVCFYLTYLKFGIVASDFIYRITYEGNDQKEIAYGFCLGFSSLLSFIITLILLRL